MNGLNRTLAVSSSGLRFVLVGIASVTVDTTVLVALRELTTTPLWLAATVSFLAALAVNFGLNMRWVFGVEGRFTDRLARYGVLVVVNYLLTLVSVLALTEVGIHYVAAKWCAIGLGAVVNFVAYRRWVFV